jgi:hypothetical protein
MLNWRLSGSWPPDKLNGIEWKLRNLSWKKKKKPKTKLGHNSIEGGKNDHKV